MQIPNIKIYVGISLALIILFILVLIIPFTKKPITNNQQLITNSPTPTSVETNPLTNQPQTNDTIPADFTGVAEEQLPKQVLDLAAQKKDLRQKTPLDSSSFTINFDYAEDKFIVTLKDPKDLNQKVFENWKATNYPGLDANQFMIK